MMLAVLSVFLFVCTVSATVNGPAFTDLAIIPSDTALNPTTTASQLLVLDGTATAFTFDFSIATPDSFLAGITQVSLTAVPNVFVPLLNLTLSAFSTPFTIGSSVSSVAFSIFIGNTTTNNTYLVAAQRFVQPVPLQAGDSDYTVLWIVVGIVGFVLLMICWFQGVAYRAARPVRLTEVDIQERTAFTIDE